MKNLKENILTGGSVFERIEFENLTRTRPLNQFLTKQVSNPFPWKWNFKWKKFRSFGTFAWTFGFATIESICFFVSLSQFQPSITCQFLKNVFSKNIPKFFIHNGQLDNLIIYTNCIFAQLHKTKVRILRIASFSENQKRSRFKIRQSTNT